MTLMGLLIRLRAARVSLLPHDGRLRVEAPIGALSDEVRQAISEHKAALMTLPRPYIREDGTLINPVDALPQYFWMPMTEKLRELNAPPQVWRHYTREPSEG